MADHHQTPTPFSLLCLIIFGFLISGLQAGNITVYWGQYGNDDPSSEGSLLEACQSGNYDIVIIGTIYQLGSSQPIELNIAGHSVTALRSHIKDCQSLGIKVFISIGGVNVILASPDDARKVANELWDKYLGGESDERPLGEAVLDGIDFNIFGTSFNHWEVLAVALSSFSNEKYKVHLSGAPECVFPDVYLNTALQTGVFDYVWIKFYNNPTCELSGNGNALKSAWDKWTTNVPATWFYLGLPASPSASSSGYIEPEVLLSDVLPYLQKSENFGGIMLFDRYNDKLNNYSSTISASQASKPGNIAVYWGQYGNDDPSSEGSLLEACQSGNYDIVIIGTIYQLGSNQPIELNVAGHSETALRSHIKDCQSLGIKVFISIGGVNVILASADDARKVANELWDKYLGGESNERPLGEAVLDGIDFNIFGTSFNHWEVLAVALSSFSNEKYKVHLSGAPECVFPDVYLNTALQTGVFDYVWIKFYNNPTCELSGNGNALKSAWDKWMTNVPATWFYLGLPASPSASSSGYIEPEVLLSDVLPYLQKSEKYGGVMLFSRYHDKLTNYSSTIRLSVLPSAATHHTTGLPLFSIV